METTRLSSKGQIIVPKAFRDALQWAPGLELIAQEQGDGVLLRPKAPFDPTTLSDVAGRLKTRGKPKTDAAITSAFKAAAKKAWRGA